MKVGVAGAIALMIAVTANSTLNSESPAPAGPAQPPRGQAPDLNRLTKPDDKTPVFDFGYFVGTWTFTWDVPEGPLGPAGTIEGSTTFKPLEGRFYEAVTEAKGPAGPFTTTELIGYLPDRNALSRLVTDTRGYSFLQVGTIGGDLGGQFTIYFESAPFSVKGTSVRVKHAMRLLSPLNFRVAASVSEDGGPFINYGNPWWRKDGPPPLAQFPGELWRGLAGAP